MFREFLEMLKPVNIEEKNEWQEVLTDYDDKCGSEEPTLFWYLSSGIDLRALVHFNKKDTSEVYKTPTIDIFVYSDYGGITKELRKWYDNLDRGSVTLYKDYPRIRAGRDPLVSYLLQKALVESGSEDYQTYISLEQMIPLRYFTSNEVSAINIKYKGNRHPSVRNTIIADDIHFCYSLIKIISNYFGEEYFPLMISPIENWVLMEEIWKKQGILFDYVCGVCDGCRKGGAYKCVNANYKDFLPVMKKKRKFWVSDHIHWRGILPNGEFERTFHQIAELQGWGDYNPKGYGTHSIRVSYLYEIKTESDAQTHKV